MKDNGMPDASDLDMMALDRAERDERHTPSARQMHAHHSDYLAATLAEVAALRKDAERYRWLKAADPYALCDIAYRVPAACEVEGDVDATIDAARGEVRHG